MTRRTYAPHRTHAIWTALLLGAVAFLPSTGLAQAVSGTVVDSLGGAIAGASVSIEGSRDATTTDGSGAFRFQRVPPGTVTLNVRRLGYRQRSVTVVSESAGAAGLVITLVAVPEVLPTVEVVRKPEVFDARLA